MSERRPIVVREARAADVPALTRLCGQLGYGSGEAQVQRRFERICEDREHRIFVAEDSAGAVVGWVQVHLTRWLASDLRGEVAGLIVSAEARGHGVGRQLMQAAIGAGYADEDYMAIVKLAAQQAGLSNEDLER